MRYFLYILITLSLLSCGTKKPTTTKPKESTDVITDKKSFENADFIISFGSGNNQQKENPFWDEILSQKPDVWIWGGDNIYCDTEDVNTLKKCYEVQLNKPDYQRFTKHTNIIGVWDDHDYGVNDGGVEYPIKEASQELFLDFIDVLCLSDRRSQKGTYHSIDYHIKGKIIKIILLDTRYFRTALTKDPSPKKRYKPNKKGEGTMLGVTQWKWLENTLKHSDADYNVIMSSIQFLANKHGYEAWANMPHEIKKMENLIVESKAKRVVVLSGDRHISEVSLKEIGKKKYPLIDFTSSGLTHAYTGFKGEENPYRVSKVIHQKSYGLVKFDLKNKLLVFEMWGENKKMLDAYRLNLK
jgi:alkaline phosphatase D